MGIEREYRKTARHEAYHACYAHYRGMEVEEVSIRHNAEALGTTTIILPLRADTLWWVYKQRPIQTLKHMRSIVGVLLAPVTVMESEASLQGVDGQVLRQWQTRWNFAAPFSDPPGPPWVALRLQAQEEVRRWFWLAGRLEQTWAITEALMQQTTLTGEAFLKIVQRHPLDPLLYMKARGHHGSFRHLACPVS